ncbi:hypothetical protein [Metabacillus litoralis]|uniref:hypothetical protein n=1 Tax=Metabacillus litoralis TaxID=152268 RepID=UPI003B21ED4F
MQQRNKVFLLYDHGCISEMEAELIYERTKSGLDVARARGRKGGRPPIHPDKLKYVYNTL